jgi:hypothetical protein
VPKAGFWAIGGYKISFRTDGRWYADEEVIANARIALLFSRSIRADGRGGWMVDVGVDRQPVTVLDTPLVVSRVTGDAERGFVVKANDDIETELDCASLAVGDDHVLYCTLDRGERGRFEARFLRPAYYDLARSIDDRAGGAALVCKGARHALQRRQAASKPS